MNIINHEKKDIIPLTNEEKESYENQQICYICEEEFCTNTNKKEFKKKQKVRDHDHYTGKYRGAAHSICNLRYKIPKEIPVVFHNGSTYDYHFIIKQLAKEFKGNFDCLGENTEKYITFSVPIKKELKNGKVIICKLKLMMIMWAERQAEASRFGNTVKFIKWLVKIKKLSKISKNCDVFSQPTFQSIFA